LINALKPYNPNENMAIPKALRYSGYAIGCPLMASYLLANYHFPELRTDQRQIFAALQRVGRVVKAGAKMAVIYKLVRTLYFRLTSTGQDFADRGEARTRCCCPQAGDVPQRRDVPEIRADYRSCTFTLNFLMADGSPGSLPVPRGLPGLLHELPAEAILRDQGNLRAVHREKTR